MRFYFFMVLFFLFHFSFSAKEKPVVICSKYCYEKSNKLCQFSEIPRIKWANNSEIPAMKVFNLKAKYKLFTKRKKPCLGLILSWNYYLTSDKQIFQMEIHEHRAKSIYFQTVILGHSYLNLIKSSTKIVLKNCHKDLLRFASVYVITVYPIPTSHKYSMISNFKSVLLRTPESQQNVYQKNTTKIQTFFQDSNNHNNLKRPYIAWSVVFVLLFFTSSAIFIKYFSTLKQKFYSKKKSSQSKVLVIVQNTITRENQFVDFCLKFGSILHEKLKSQIILSLWELIESENNPSEWFLRNIVQCNLLILISGPSNSTDTGAYNVASNWVKCGNHFRSKRLHVIMVTCSSSIDLKPFVVRQKLSLVSEFSKLYNIITKESLSKENFAFLKKESKNLKKFLKENHTSSI